MSELSIWRQILNRLDAINSTLKAQQPFPPTALPGTALISPPSLPSAYQLQPVVGSSRWLGSQSEFPGVQALGTVQSMFLGDFTAEAEYEILELVVTVQFQTTGTTRRTLALRIQPGAQQGANEVYSKPIYDSTLALIPNSTIQLRLEWSNSETRWRILSNQTIWVRLTANEALAAGEDYVVTVHAKIRNL